MDVDGVTEPGFGPVRAALERVLEDQGGGGVAVAAFVGGRPVVDLWGGTVPADGLVHTWSAIKPLVACGALVLVAQGRLDVDAPVASVWPEFATAGKDGVLVRHLLLHEAGLSAVPGGDVAGLLDWEATCTALACTAPAWPPGSAHGEHALTYGHLIGELVRRVDGRRLGPFLAEELAGPLGLDLHVGVPAAELDRVADLGGVTATWWSTALGPPGSLRAGALGTGVDGVLVNSAAWRRGEVPAVNGHATARGLAVFYRAVLDGAAPAGVLEPGRCGLDLVTGRDVTWTLGGMQLDPDEIGMGGAGGSFAGARPALGLAWAFLTTEMGTFARAEALERVLLAAV